MDVYTNTNGRIWNLPQMAYELLKTIKDDRKRLKNINVYYEFHLKHECINAIDGDVLFKKIKENYERQGLLLLKERKDVTIGTEKLKMLIFRSNDENIQTFDFYGGLAGYFQASSERVMYMTRF